MIDRSTPDWYKDAVIYQLHVKAYFDANDDGIGDFDGLIHKLDYIKSLGVTAVWLLPFYPSPLRDDGYDIADYRGINPSYGNFKEFRRFVKACHDRDLRVITELVINHTSDQHPWFQRARKAKKGSKHRDFYVWSDTDQKYQGTRIIFCDTEKSNWTWDPVAQQYYWHRFYSHQPDLNFDNPAVMDAVLNVLHFWLKAGVDGMRLDAVPYLIEREGTNNENLAETHEVLKRIRKEVDEHYPDRMLLAEANQWPEDTAEYFGDGDECQMSFHFPLMPRMYMALAMEDRHPITDILRQTPEIPENCQWAIFLRNHDELTLEMVTDKERDYLWEVYASDRRMRINLGIRRRLWPLMERDRRKIELLYGLLLSMPGTPVLYYGDEIGMGDNIYLGDRDGVRTPMQWTPDRNGGFSRAHPQKLFLPAVQDPLYGYQAVNVEMQEADKNSFLNWIRRMLRVRAGSSAFGRGELKFLYPGNRKVFAYIREHEGESVLCVVNLSRSAQAVELDLSDYAGHVPIELADRTAFPPIGDLPYLLTMPAYAFYWFALTERGAMPAWHEEVPDSIPEFSTVVLRKTLTEAVEGKNARMLESDVLPTYMPNHRWFAGKDRPIDAVSIEQAATLEGGEDGYLLTAVQVTQGEDVHRYQLPMAVTWNEDLMRAGSPVLPYVFAKARRFRSVGALHDAVMDDGFPLSALRAMRGEAALQIKGGSVRAEAYGKAREMEIGPDTEVRRFNVEQSNSSMIVGGTAVLKFYRKLVSGPHPELEIARYLTLEAGYENTPALLGSLELVDKDGEATALAVAQEMVFNQGDGWRFMLNYLDGDLEERHFNRQRHEPPQHGHESNLALVGRLGQRTGELHRAFARDTDDAAFAPEPVGGDDVTRWREGAERQARAAFDALRRAERQAEGTAAEQVTAMLAREDEVMTRIGELAQGEIDALKTRLHGDYHLGQVLVVERDFYLIDFEGEPAKTLAERRAKTSALRDVAGMLRSFDYAAWSAIVQLSERLPEAAESVEADALAWRDTATAVFLAAYRQTLGDSRVWPAEEADGRRLLELFTLEKALYEIVYEAANRPKWLHIPLSGLAALLDGTTPLTGDLPHGDTA